MSGFHAARQPLQGRSDNTMHSGARKHIKKNMDSVQSLNDIALRDAEVRPHLLPLIVSILRVPTPRLCCVCVVQELKSMMQRQAQEPLHARQQKQLAYPPQTRHGAYPQNQAAYAPNPGSYAPPQNSHPLLQGTSHMPTQGSGNAQMAYASQQQHHEENSHPGQQEFNDPERSFSLHTAPMPATARFPSKDLYTPFSDQERQMPVHGATPGFYAVPDTAGAFFRHHSAKDLLEQTAFDGNSTYESGGMLLGNKPFQRDYPAVQRLPPPPAWAAIPAKQMPASPGELSDYMPAVRQKKVNGKNVMSSAQAFQSVLPQQPLPPAAKKEEDITISFKPKVALVKGNTVSQVRLVLADFEGADADYIKLESTPNRAFIGAYWTSKTKELALILGDDVAAHTPVNIMIPASSGIRRVVKEEDSIDESSEPEHSIPHTSSRNISADIKATETPKPLPPTTLQDLSQEAAVVDAVADTVNEIAKAPSFAPEPVHEEEEKLFGIDIELVWSEKDEAYAVSEIVRGGAAWKNGLVNVGNIITHVDEMPLEGKSLEQAMVCFLGQPSGAVILTVRDHVDPLSGQVQTRDVKVLRYDSVDMMTIDFYDEEEFCDIPQVEEVEEHAEVVSQAEWARRQLAQGPKEVTKMVDMNDISKKVSDQSKAAKEKLQTRSSITKTAYDAESVAEQARWAKDQLENRKDNTQKTLFDADMVAEQTRAAMQSLANLPQKEVEKKFDAQSVAEQARWAKQQLENRQDYTKTTRVDTASVSEQAQWAKKKLLAKEQGLADESMQQDENKQADAPVMGTPVIETHVACAASEEDRVLPCEEDRVFPVACAEQASEHRDALQHSDALQHGDASEHGDALDALCRLAGLDDLPGMDEVLASKSPMSQPLAASAVSPPAAPAASAVPAAEARQAPIQASALPVTSAVESDEDKAEKKRRAVQKRLEFLAQPEVNKSANDSNAIEVRTEDDAPGQLAVCTAAVHNAIILAPSPIESESAGSSPTPEQHQAVAPVPSALFTAPAPPPASSAAPPSAGAAVPVAALAVPSALPLVPAVALSAPVAQASSLTVMRPTLTSSRQSEVCGHESLNGSMLPAPTKNFVNTVSGTSLSRDINVEEEMQFLDALTQSPGAGTT